MIKRFCALFFFFIVTLLYAQPAELEPQDVVRKARQMMACHPSYKQVNGELAKRIMISFCEELDPFKAYFLKGEVYDWIEPSDHMINMVLQAFHTGNFSQFEQLFFTMHRAIERRRGMQERLLFEELPEEKRFNIRDLQYVANEDELFERALLIRAMQMKSTEQLDPELVRKSLQRVEKRRQYFEHQRMPQDTSIYTCTLMTFIMKSFASALDSQTCYFTPGEAEQLLICMQQRLFGIGVLLQDDVDGVSVIKIVEGGPAACQGGLELGDKIIAVNNEPVVGLDVLEVVEMIRGRAGSIVALKILRHDAQGNETQSIEVKLRRGEVVVQEQRYGVMTKEVEGGTLACLRLHSFYQDAKHSSYFDLYKQLHELQQQHELKGVILDLRCNPGGLLTQAVAVSGLFLDPGVVVSIKDEVSGVGHIRNIGTKKAWDGPLVILVNRASASASEIVAQTLQDWGRAIVVGDDRSFGKGSFQLFSLGIDGSTAPNPQGEYKITRGRYYTVSGKSPQLTGVKSDIVVPGVLSFTDIGEQFTRFPLGEDAIDPHFVDTFDDVSFMQKPLLSRLYEVSRQTQSNRWSRCIPMLKEHSECRLNNDIAYQDFLDRARNESTVEEETDYQLEEAWKIMEELVEMSTVRRPARAA